MQELADDFPCSRLVPARYVSVQNQMWDFLGSVKNRIEFKLCFQTENGVEVVLRTVVTPMPDDKHVMMEHHVTDFCDDLWSIGDFTHFPTHKDLPPQCKATVQTTIQNLYDAWNIMRDTNKDLK